MARLEDLQTQFLSLDLIKEVRFRRRQNIKKEVKQKKVVAKKRVSIEDVLGKISHAQMEEFLRKQIK